MSKKRSKACRSKKWLAEQTSTQSRAMESNLKKAQQPVSEQLVLDQHHYLQDVSMRYIHCHEVRQEPPLTISLKLDKVQHKPVSGTSHTSSVQQLKLVECWYQPKEKDNKQADTSDTANTTEETEHGFTFPTEPNQTAETQSPKDGFDLEVKRLEDTDSAVLIEEKEDVVGYPLAPTNKQKEARHLARQRKILEIKHREMAEDRKMRLLRRQGLLSMQTKKGRKNVTWQKDSELVKIFSYST